MVGGYVQSVGNELQCTGHMQSIILGYFVKGSNFLGLLIYKGCHNLWSILNSDANFQLRSYSRRCNKNFAVFPPLY